MSEQQSPHPGFAGRLAATFIGTLAMWWLYFGTSSKDATAAITRSDDPGRIGAYFHYVHAILIAGIGGMVIGGKAFALSGISLCAISALALNLLLPGGSAWRKHPPIDPEI